MAKYQLFNPKTGETGDASDEKGLQNAFNEGFKVALKDKNGNTADAGSFEGMTKADAEGYSPIYQSDIDKNDDSLSATAGDTWTRFIDGVTLGWADEIEAKAKSKWDKYIEGSNRPEEELYREYRDKDRVDSAARAARSPVAGTLANIAGEALGQTGLTAAATAATVGTGGAAVPIAALAAGGGLSALGNSDADLTRGEYLDAAKDTAKGAAIGAAIGSAAKYAGKLLRPGLDEIAHTPTINSGNVKNSTALGKLYNSTEGLETGLKKVGNIPELIGAGDLTASNAASKATSFMSNPFTTDMASYEAMRALPLTERVANTLKGGAKMVGGGAGGGAALGVVGGPAGMAIGAKTGAATAAGLFGTSMAAKAGGAALGAARKGFQSFAETAVKNPQMLNQMGIYGTILAGAAQRGRDALIAKDFILQQTEPDYQKMKRQWEESQQGDGDDEQESN